MSARRESGLRSKQVPAVFTTRWPRLAVVALSDTVNPHDAAAADGVAIYSTMGKVLRSRRFNTTGALTRNFEGAQLPRKPTVSTDRSWPTPSAPLLSPMCWWMRSIICARSGIAGTPTSMDWNLYSIPSWHEEACPEGKSVITLQHPRCGRAHHARSGT